MRLRVLLVMCVTCLLAMNGPALARPGGGGSYHGGGTTGGGFGGGSTGFSGTGVSNRGGGGVPLGPFGTLILLGIIGGVVVLVLVQRNRQARGFQAAQYDATAAQRASASLAPLQARDPQLTEQSIAQHVMPMQDQLRNAWCAGNMLPARPFVSDGVYSRFQVQLALMRQENRRNVMSDARVLALTVEAVADAAPLDVVHLRLTAAARDTEVPCNASDAQIHAALAKVSAQPYTEIWTLVRCTGAQTKPGDFQVGTSCPKCGAPLAGGEMLKCRYCGALVCSGEHDWVLAEITQLSEWRPRQQRAPGLDALRGADAGVAAEVLEDRASYLFWKWVEAARANSAAPMRKCSTPALLASGARWEWARGASDVSVGASDVAKCVVGAPDGQDHVDVLVKWSARFNGSPAYTPCRTVVRMARKSGVQSKLSMTALICQACGAPLSDSDTTKCDHCGVELAAGDQAWVLEAVMQPGQS
jgi:predicted lipid-binding transport protein (Tim44 family)